MWDALDSSDPVGSARTAVPEEDRDGVERLLGFMPDALQRRVLESESRRGILNCTRQWGKSTITAAMAAREAERHRGSLTLVVSPSARQSGEFLRKAAAMARRLGHETHGDGDNEMSLAFPNEARIIGLPGNEATVRGFSAVTLLLVDEAARVSDELYHAIRPMLAVSGGRLWLMSTPWGQRGFFHETWARGGPEWERIRVPGTECPRIDGRFLAEERRVMGERWFRQEYLCEFVETGGGVFDRGAVERAFRDDVEPLCFG
ncbi:MAG: terminase family protein [Bryobacteraceae bacterium]